MAIGKYQPFVKGDDIYMMDTETGQVFQKAFTKGKANAGFEIENEIWWIEDAPALNDRIIYDDGLYRKI